MGLTVCLKGSFEISAALGGGRSGVAAPSVGGRKKQCDLRFQTLRCLKYYKLFNRVLSVEECLFFPIRGLTSFVLLQYIDKLQTGKLN